MSRPKMMVIEDNPADVFILKRMLEMQGEESGLEIAADGEGSLQYVHSRRKNPHDVQPCVLLLDSHLSGQDGIEVLRAIREEPFLSHIQVVVGTSGVSPAEEAELRQLSPEASESISGSRSPPIGIFVKSDETDRLSQDSKGICSKMPPREGVRHEFCADR
jgi:CheY-like chemotaxis protein